MSSFSGGGGGVPGTGIKLRLPVNPLLMKNRPRPPPAAAPSKVAISSPSTYPPSYSSPGAGSLSNRGRRITEFIADRQLRIKSYIRRRPIPFKRVAEMDAACGTRSLLVQYCPDFDECLYNATTENAALVDMFLSEAGVRITNVEDLVKKYVDTLDVPDNVPTPAAEPTPAATQSASKQNMAASLRYSGDVDQGDDDYAPTVSERKRNAQAKRREAMEKVREEKKAAAAVAAAAAVNLSALVSTPPPGNKEALKALKSRRESLFAKIAETDEVCDCRSFLLVLAADREAAYFYGHPDLVGKFFSGQGVSARQFADSVNVRPVR